MAGNSVNGGGTEARSGAQTLVLLSTPLASALLNALSEGPKRQIELRNQIGAPAQTTLRAQLKRLEALGAIEKRRRNRFPGTLEYELSPAGADILFVVEALARWLARSPERALALGSDAAKAAIRALADGWSTTILAALAAEPLSLTQLDRAIESLSYPTIERRLAALRLAGQVEALPSGGRGTPQAITAWAREGVGPIVAAARWERRHTPRCAAAIGRAEAEALFQLAVPLLRLDRRLSGACRLAMEVPSGGRRDLAGVLVEIADGGVESCVPQLHGEVDAWSMGSVRSWLDAIAAGDIDCIERGGDGGLVRAVLEGLNEALFDPAVDSPAQR